MHSREKKQKHLEKIVLILQRALQMEGHDTKRFSDGKRFSTTAYDCIVVKGNDGKYYEISVSECEPHTNPHTGERISADYTYNNI